MILTLTTHQFFRNSPLLTYYLPLNHFHHTLVYPITTLMSVYLQCLARNHRHNRMNFNNNKKSGGVIIEDTDLGDSDCDESEWKKGAWPQDPYLSLFDSEKTAPACDMSNRSDPLSYFELFFDSEAIDIIVTETNRFASQYDHLNWAPVTKMEIKALLGMLVQMGIHKLPSFEDYWSTDPLLHVV